MKLDKYPLVLFLFVLFSFSLRAETLAKFDLNCFDGWIYTRNSVPLTSENINARKIKIFRAYNGDNYALKSPVLDCGEVKWLRVKFNYYTANCDQEAYDLTKSSPYIEIVDLNDNPLVTKFYQLPKKELIHEIVVFLKVPQGAQNLRVRFEAPYGDMNSNGAIYWAEISSSENEGDAIKGDVDGNQTVDVNDIMALINMILGTSELNLPLADLNGDGNVDVSDVGLLIGIVLAVDK